VKRSVFFSTAEHHLLTLSLSLSLSLFHSLSLRRGRVLHLAYWGRMVRFRYLLSHFQARAIGGDFLHLAYWGRMGRFRYLLSYFQARAIGGDFYTWPTGAEWCGAEWCDFLHLAYLGRMGRFRYLLSHFQARAEGGRFLHMLSLAFSYLTGADSDNPPCVSSHVVEQLGLPIIGVFVVYVFRTSGSCMTLAARASRRTRDSIRCQASVLGALFYLLLEPLLPKCAS
jgi:hypothetical protein